MARFGRFFGRTVSDAAGVAIGGATARTLTPGLQDLVNEAWTKHPSVPLDPGDAAVLDAAALWAQDKARGESKLSGIGGARHDALVAIASNYLTPDQVLAAWRRGFLTDAEVDEAFDRARVPPKWRAILRQFKTTILSPEQAAAAVERGEMTYDDAEGEAARSGIPPWRFRVIERLAGLAPSTEQLLSMRRRGVIDDARMHKGFVQGNVRSEWADALAALAEVLLSPAELASMVVEGVIPQDTATALAERVGMNAENFDRAVRLAGSPPGAGQLLDLWNRGEIAEADVDRGLRQSRLKPEWVAAVKALRRHIPTVSDVIRFAVKDVFDPTAVRRFGLDDEFPTDVLPLAEQQGIDAEQMRWQWMAHWRNVAPTQLFRMRHRDVISDDELDLGLKTADYAPWWRDKLKAITYLTPGRIDLRRMLAAGIITREEAVTGYRHLGYRADDAERMVRLAASVGTGTAKDLTLGNLTTEYEGLHLSRTEYVARVQALGYSAEEAGQFADLTDDKRVQRARNARVQRIHTTFVGHKISEADARDALDAADVRPEARDLILDEWREERAVNVARLTKAQAKKAYAKALLSRDDVLGFLTDQGMRPDEAALYIDS